MHVIAAAYGLSALLAHVPTAYVVLKFVGAAYLVWLGVSMLRSAGARAEAPSMRKKSGPYQKLSQWLAGSLMIFLGIRLALSNE